VVLSHKYKCIFVKVPKTAGTAIHRFFEENDPESIRSDLNEWPWGHRTADDLKNDPQIAPYWDSYFKFAFIREPFKWVVSLYNYEHEWDYSGETYSRLHALLDDGRVRIPPDFKLNIFDVFKVFFLSRNVMRYYLPQTPYLNAPLDFIGIYENIEEDFEFIKKRTGIPLDLNLAKVNVSRYNRPLTFDTTAREALNAVLKDDIRYYDLMYKKLDSPHKRSMGTTFFTTGPFPT
jgi:hypothetical protein